MDTIEIKLTDVCDFQGGTQPPKEEWINEPRDGYVRMLQIRDFTQNKTEHVEFVKDTQKLNKCKADDILIGRYGASVGKILTGLEGAYNVAIIKTIPDETKLLKKYLYYVLTGNAFQNFIKSIGARAAQAGFNKDDLSYFKLHLPTLENQERITTILSKAEALIKQRKVSIALLDELIKFSFLKMFGDPSTNKYGFSTGRISDVVIDVKYGTSKPAEDEGKYPYLRMNNITYQGYWDFSSLKYINVSNEEKDKYLVKKGDLIFNRTNSKELVGKSAVFGRSEEMIIAGYLIRLRVNEKANPWYLWGYLNSNHGKKTLFELCRNIVGMANINAQELKAIKILIPPINLQNNFAKVLEIVEEIKVDYENSLEELEKLLGSLSQKAFRGKLNISRSDSEEEYFYNEQAESHRLEREWNEISFSEDYLKNTLIPNIFKRKPFTFDQLWQEITKVQFETLPEYDEVADMLFNWLAAKKPFIKQQYNETTKQIELLLNETAKA